MSVTIESREAGYLVLMLNRPEVKNALNPELNAAIEDAADRVSTDPELAALVVTGAQGVFCSGADVKARWQVDHAKMIRDTVGAREALTQCRKPVIAAVEGAAFGGGLELALSADIVLISKSAKCAVSEFAMGALPVSGHISRMVRGAGHYKAAQLLLSGKSFSGEDAVNWGLASEALEPGTTLASAEALAASIAQKPVSLSVMAKEILRSAVAQPGAEALERAHGMSAFSHLMVAMMVQKPTSQKA